MDCNAKQTFHSWLSTLKVK